MELYDSSRNEAISKWIKARIAQIHNQISAGDVLVRHGIELRWGGDREEQISCPFHGADKNPSARYFPNKDNSRSHVWCFACHENWDVIGLWVKFNGKEEKFTRTLFQIEKAFGLTPPESQIPDNVEDVYNPLTDEVSNLFRVCEKILRDERDSFEMKAHLKLGAIVDHLLDLVDRGALPLKEAKVRLTQVIEKIGEMARASKVSNSEP
jgi:hypothetical protein